MIAKFDGFCIDCKKAIKRGQQIQGSTRNYRHSDCENPYAVPATRLEDPNAPVSERQLELIAALLAERELTMGEASVIIDHLLKRPRKQNQDADVEFHSAAA